VKSSALEAQTAEFLTLHAGTPKQTTGLLYQHAESWFTNFTVEIGYLPGPTSRFLEHQEETAFAAFTIFKNTTELSISNFLPLEIVVDLKVETVAVHPVEVFFGVRWQTSVTKDCNLHPTLV